MQEVVKGWYMLSNPAERNGESTGYPWTVVRVTTRDEYMNALEDASVKGNIQPFAEFIGNCVRKQLARQTVAFPACCATGVQGFSSIAVCTEFVGSFACQEKRPKP